MAGRTGVGRPGFVRRRCGAVSSKSWFLWAKVTLRSEASFGRSYRSLPDRTSVSLRRSRLDREVEPPHETIAGRAEKSPAPRRPGRADLIAIDGTAPDEAKARRMVETVDHPKLGPVRLLGTPFKFSKTPTSIRRHPPTLGENTEEVLADGFGAAKSKSSAA